MSNIQEFDYYYGKEAEQFSFFRVPKLLVKDERFKHLSNDAKLLYGLMLDRMSLSMENGWLDEYNRVYIYYTMESIMSDLNCGKDKCIKMLAELDNMKGIGLIRRVKQGLGRPDIIYVMDFVSEKEVKHPDDDSLDSEDAKVQDKYTNSRVRKNRTQEFGKTDCKSSEKPNSKFRKNRPQDFGKAIRNKTEQNKNNCSYTDLSNRSNERNMMDEMEIEKNTELLKANLDYDMILPSLPEDEQKLFRELFGVILNVLCAKCETIKIGGVEYPYKLVQDKFLQLNYLHLKYVMDCMKKTTKPIGNIKSYLLASLFNSLDTKEHYYNQAVKYDMYDGGWKEKGVL